jgi:hypothetical protein
VLLHGIALMAALHVVGQDPMQFTWAVAIVCGTLGVLDYRTASLRDYGLALSAARAMRPDMPPVFAPLGAATFARWMMGTVFGLASGFFLFLVAMAPDTGKQLLHMQNREDQRVESFHAEDVEADRSRLLEWVRVARSELHLAESLDTRKAQAEARTAHSAWLNELRIEEASLKADIVALRETADQARERMQCESAGTVTPRCPGATGVPGEREAWANARDTANAAEASILDLEVALAALKTKISGAETQMPPAVSAQLPVAVRQAVKNVMETEKALAEFDVQAVLKDRVEADPARRVYDPSSVRDQVLALEQILDESPHLWWYMILVKAAMVALESLILVMGLGARPSEYHVQRGKALILHWDASTNAVRASYLQNQAQNAQFARDVMEDDPKVVRIRKGLARESAREAAAGLQASEANYTEHLVRGSRPHGIAAE